ncbi:DUF1003 domain-containing protein [Herbiconiux moechotypicola]|uniref:DUF1003 domain-containing protein n=1 Tax=Herbiconiux moechotypicola TaxID=637393 RepID=A0ABN3DN52_9MICO|nr:DUF1003 domain-containing protein [Herbiconiux moechotypicola]MCS5730319.1 DUF1003 domain-containing protein [Herbiconiux moechotypicola]
MARKTPNTSSSGLDAPKGLRSSVIPRRPVTNRDRFGRVTEAIARAMGTPWFLVGLTLFVVVWMIFNTYGPEAWRFDSAAIGFTALTLILSLQASYAAPLILLAQNRQDDRDRVQFEQDRQRAERNLADTEYLAREVVALRLALQDMASKEFIRAELRALLEELDRGDGDTASAPSPRTRPTPVQRGTTR